MTTNLELRDSDLDTRRYILEPTTASARLACRSAATWTFITAGDRIRALTARHPIKPISASCRSAWQPNLGRRSTYRCGNSVQTTGTTSDLTFEPSGADREQATVDGVVVVRHWKYAITAPGKELSAKVGDGMKG